MAFQPPPVAWQVCFTAPVLKCLKDNTRERPDLSKVSVSLLIPLLSPLRRPRRLVLLVIQAHRARPAAGNYVSSISAFPTVAVCV